jgi:hypothetical protein
VIKPLKREGDSIDLTRWFDWSAETCWKGYWIIPLVASPPFWCNYGLLHESPSLGLRIGPVRLLGPVERCRTSVRCHIFMRAIYFLAEFSVRSPARSVGVPGPTTALKGPQSAAQVELFQMSAWWTFHTHSWYELLILRTL